MTTTAKTRALTTTQTSALGKLTSGLSSGQFTKDQVNAQLSTMRDSGQITQGDIDNVLGGSFGTTSPSVGGLTTQQQGIPTEQIGERTTDTKNLIKNQIQANNATAQQTTTNPPAGFLGQRGNAQTQQTQQGVIQKTPEMVENFKTQIKSNNGIPNDTTQQNQQQNQQPQIQEPEQTYQNTYAEEKARIDVAEQTQRAVQDIQRMENEASLQIVNSIATYNKGIRDSLEATQKDADAKITALTQQMESYALQQQEAMQGMMESFNVERTSAVELYNQYMNSESLKSAEDGLAKKEQEINDLRTDIEYTQQEAIEELKGKAPMSKIQAIASDRITRLAKEETRLLNEYGYLKSGYDSELQEAQTIMQLTLQDQEQQEAQQRKQLEFTYGMSRDQYDQQRQMFQTQLGQIEKVSDRAYQEGLIIEDRAYEQLQTESNRAYERELTADNRAYEQANKLDDRAYNEYLTQDDRAYNEFLTQDSRAYNETLIDSDREYAREEKIDDREYSEDRLTDDRAYQEGLVADDRAYSQAQLEDNRAYARETLVDERQYTQTVAEYRDTRDIDSKISLMKLDENMKREMVQRDLDFRKANPETQLRYETTEDGTMYALDENLNVVNKFDSSSFESGNETVDAIKQFEGYRSNAYLDSAGVRTIGYGTTRINGVPVKKGDTISEGQAEILFNEQLKTYQTRRGRVETDLSPTQEAALTSFEYNLGQGIRAKNAQPILDAVNSKDFAKAGNLMKQYVNAGGKKVQGLVNRRNVEAGMIQKVQTTPTAKTGGTLPSIEFDNLQQAKSFQFADRMMKSNDILTSIESEELEGGFSTMRKIKANEWKPKVLESDRYQQYDQGKRDFINSILRQESGAVISDQEFENAEEQYFVQSGDSEAVIAQKQQNRLTSLQGMQITSGQVDYFSKAQSTFQTPMTSHFGMVIGEKEEHVSTEFDYIFDGM